MPHFLRLGKGRVVRTLYHHWISPYARKIRLLLDEKKLDYDLELEKTWDPSNNFRELNPASEVPVLIELNGKVFCDHNCIAEYIEEAYPEDSLLGDDLAGRAEVRRLTGWFDAKFAREVTHLLVDEIMIKRLAGVAGAPNSAAIRQGRANIRPHLSYISYLIDRRRWLAGDKISLADLAAAAHLSSLDYGGYIPWDEFQGAKEWYARIKSRPSFRGLLVDRIPGLAPAAHYTNLDF